MQFLDSVQATFALPAMLGDPPCADEAAVRQGAAIFWQGRATLPAITPRAP